MITKSHIESSILSLAIFDLDNTLIAGDSDHAWGEFLVEQELVDAESFKQANDQFYEDYCRGELDIHAYLRFALTPLSRFSAEQLRELHAEFMQSKIDPIRLPKAEALIEKHRQNGDILLVITATNRFVTEPIVRAHNIDNLLASDGEMINGRYTGEPSGTPCFAEGKVLRLQQWLKSQDENVAKMDKYFYSDSRNDIPLLESVDHPVAVDPDATLRETAEARGWPVISLR